MTPIQQLMLGAGGAKKMTYMDDLFSTLVYKGDGNGTRTFTNGIDLTEGGLVWTKRRDANNNHLMFDTARGGTKYIIPSSNGAEGSNGLDVTFNNNGYQPNQAWSSLNNSEGTYASWTFRKAPGFFDVVTYTGTGSSVLTLSHDLGSVPGMILIKRLDGASTDWIVYHRSTGISNYLKLNATDAAADDTGDYLFNNVAPTATHFTIGAGHDAVNANTNNYVAYLFAHDEQSFGENENASVIKCGSYTGNGQANEAGPFINLGWEPQFLLIKNTSDSASWAMFDTMRGIRTGGKTQTLSADLTNAEGDYTNFATVTATGFHAGYNDNYTNSSGDTYIYLAIRRPDSYVGKPAEAGTDVFAMDTGSGSSTIPNFDSGFPVDFAFYRSPASTSNWWLNARLTQGTELKTNSSDAEGSYANGTFDSNTGWNKAPSNDSSAQSWMWKRHTGFDVQAVTTTGSGYQFLKHGLGVVPQMIWMKKRDGTGDWHVYHKDLNGGTTPYNWSLHLNDDSAEWESGGNMWGLSNLPDNETVTILDSYFGGAGEYLMLLFASNGISKVGSYTGNGNAIGSSPLTITTGFQPRFLIIKRVNQSGWNWNLFDSVRGIGSGNDPRLRLNQSGAQQTSYDFVEATSTGFKVNGDMGGIGASGGEYIYYAHA